MNCCYYFFTYFRDLLKLIFSVIILLIKYTVNIKNDKGVAMILDVYYVVV